MTTKRIGSPTPPLAPAGKSSTIIANAFTRNKAVEGNGSGLLFTDVNKRCGDRDHCFYYHCQEQQQQLEELLKSSERVGQHSEEEAAAATREERNQFCRASEATEIFIVATANKELIELIKANKTKESRPEIIFTSTTRVANNNNNNISANNNMEPNEETQHNVECDGLTSRQTRRPHNRPESSAIIDKVRKTSLLSLTTTTPTATTTGDQQEQASSTMTSHLAQVISLPKSAVKVSCWRNYLFLLLAATIVTSCCLAPVGHCAPIKDTSAVQQQVAASIVDDDQQVVVDLAHATAAAASQSIRQPIISGASDDASSSQQQQVAEAAALLLPELIIRPNRDHHHHHHNPSQVATDLSEEDDTILLVLVGDQSATSSQTTDLQSALAAVSPSIRRLKKRSGISDQRLAEIQMIRALKKQLERASKLAASTDSNDAASTSSS